GPGAAAARIADRRQTATTDGHGWLLGDEGSGFWIARAALLAALRALDGRGPATELADMLRQAAAGGAGERGRSAGAEHLRETGGREGASAGSGAESPVAGGGAAGTGADGRTGPRASATEDRGRSAGAVPRGAGERSAARSALVDAGFAGAPVAIARLCPVVVRAAEAGDAVAGAILDEAADRLAETVAALAPVPGEPLVTTGGLLAPAGPLLARFTARMRPYGLSPAPVPDGLAGAAALARVLR
ncbi:BadF/BadG/BcrA/BcrD ATPase family protein, partial [Streptomyces synnematoformans]|uniref:BadF/BadG/BcrA/BcrD ATPase family protein n=1 Tax=Streptomyces synnematoformans TaxID=415721 RepID=UPI0031D7E45F